MLKYLMFVQLEPPIVTFTVFVTSILEEERLTLAAGQIFFVALQDLLLLAPSHDHLQPVDVGTKLLAVPFSVSSLVLVSRWCISRSFREVRY